MTMGWLEKVAERAGISVAEADNMLRRRGICPDRPMRPARNLTITCIAFRGEKKGEATGRIDFKWSDLSSGVWALASHANLVGKSTVLEVLLWCLRGAPKGLQDDVRSWLEWVSVSFDIDDQHYLVEFNVVDGIPRGGLSRLRPGGGTDGVDEFASAEGFEAAMSHFMMATFDLDPMPARQGDEEHGQTVVHGWTALSGALYFGGDHKLLLGDAQWGGLAGRMLQMYVGLPWALTSMQAATAQKEVEHERARSTRASSETTAHTAQAHKRLKAELEIATKKLQHAGSEEATAAELGRLAAEVARLSPVVFELERRLVNAEDAYKMLTRVADEDERALCDLRENIVANSFFNGLQPTCCPRCETVVTKERVKRESVELSCSVCSEPIPSEQIGDANDTIEEAVHRRDVSKEASARSKAELAPLRADLKQARDELGRVRESLTTTAASDDFRDRRDAELEVARLEGALKEREFEPNNHTPPADAAVVDAAFKEAKSAFKAQSGDLLDRLNQEILRLGNAFGVLRLEQVNLNSRAQMELTKGGKATWFSKLTSGERLRLRIATAIALLRVGRERGVGRHPGLLIIDSPGAEETSESNLAALLQELQAVANETPGLQVLIASANAPAVIAALQDTCCRIVPEGKYLW